MKISPTFVGTCRAGQFVPDKAEGVNKCLRSREGKRTRVTISDEETPRSNPQLRYLFGVVFKIISDHTGYTPIEVRALMEGHFLTYTIAGPENRNIEVVGSVGDLKKDEMSEFIEQVVILASKHWSLYIPDPNEVEY